MSEKYDGTLWLPEKIAAEVHLYHELWTKAKGEVDRLRLENGSLQVEMQKLLGRFENAQEWQEHSREEFTATVHRNAELVQVVTALRTELAQAQQEIECWCSLRPEVQAFALVMQRKLDEHKKKHIGCPGWKGECPKGLIDGLGTEYRELRAAMVSDDGDARQAHILSECADVANWAMFIGDVLGGLMHQKGGEG